MSCPQYWSSSSAIWHRSSLSLLGSCHHTRCGTSSADPGLALRRLSDLPEQRHRLANSAAIIEQKLRLCQPVDTSPPSAALNTHASPLSTLSLSDLLSLDSSDLRINAYAPAEQPLSRSAVIASPLSSHRISAHDYNLAPPRTLTRSSFCLDPFNAFLLPHTRPQPWTHQTTKRQRNHRGRRIAI